MPVNLEVKGSLAKCLATENLIIEHKKVPTAMFDVDRRVLTLPNWDKASATVYDLLVGHEVGHALFTDNIDWTKKIDILHIDGSHHYDDVKKDFKTWSQFLKDDGVILMHDTCVETFNDKEYGVKKFFDEIDLPKCTFTDYFGLGVVSKNEKLIEQIKATFNL